jgi:D-sedoheptulose 7-phosphate isomerase
VKVDKAGGHNVKDPSTSNGGKQKRQVTPLLRGAKNYFNAYYTILDDLPYVEIEEVTAQLLRVYDEGRTVFLFGNGGSAALASHFACDLGKGTLAACNGSKRFRAIALTDNLPLITAWANDSSYDNIFAEQLQNLTTAGDIAFAISGSGNSPNVLRALETARASKVMTIGLTGYSGGQMKMLCDYCIIVPSDNMQVIEDFHLSVCHAVFASICHCFGRSHGLAAAASSSVQSA